VTAILGIDAAWTLQRPTGVALIESAGVRPSLLAAAASYGSFLDLVSESGGWQGGQAPPIERLLKAAQRIAHRPVSVVAVDMPLSLDRFASRRNADNAVSRAFGAAKCSTHSPSETRPGEVSRTYSRVLQQLGFTLATSRSDSPPVRPTFLEVYPHVALLRLCGRPERLPYKLARASKYWPECDVKERRRLLLREWELIHARLGAEIDGVAAALALPDVAASSVAMLKSFEDTLDAIVCAWVGLRFAQGAAEPYGDDRAAIWMPLAPDHS
jgi:predicted RNase H-like nuclease